MSPVFQCRSCGNGAGALILDLGVQPLANNLLRPEDLAKSEPTFPLRLFACRRCWLLQLADLVPPIELFSEYLYFSSFSDAMLRHAAAAAAGYIREFGLGSDSRVVEIASNDGYLLQHFQRAGIPCLGIEPAANIARVAREKGIETLTRFFTAAMARELVANRGPADLILGNNVFAHAPDTNDFTAGLATLLKPGGRIILEFPYAADLVERTEFDTIYHEHVFYFTLTALRPLFGRHELEIVRAEHLPIHGGSLRVFVAHAGTCPVEGTVTDLEAEEQRRGVAGLPYYQGFADRVRALVAELSALVRRLKAEGRSVAAYGASAKGSTLLNFAGLGREALDFVVDRSPHKQGRLTPGMHLPILPVDQLLARRPDYTLLLTWNFAEEILEQQRAYRAAGGKFILPIPRVSVV
jgi:SAM-dependent methyltransferase